jgi:tyrosyl-tRNA synthetase
VAAISGEHHRGIDLCHQKLDKHVFGSACRSSQCRRLVGKTEKGAVWLDPRRTRVYPLSVLIRTDGRDGHTSNSSFLSREEIAQLEKQHTAKPEARVAHTALAKAVTELIHGGSATAEAVRASEILFGGELEGISEATFNEIVGEVPSKEVEMGQLTGEGLQLVELLC